MRTRFIVVPCKRRRTWGSWAWPGWSLAENLIKSLIVEEFRHKGLGLGDAHNAYHSPLGAAMETVWKNVEVLVYNRNHPKFLQTLNNRGDKAAGPGMQGLHKKDSIWTEHLKLIWSQDSGGNSWLWLFPKIDVHVEVVPQGLPCLAYHIISCRCATWWPFLSQSSEEEG